MVKKQVWKNEQQDLRRLKNDNLVMHLCTKKDNSDDQGTGLTESLVDTINGQGVVKH